MPVDKRPVMSAIDSFRTQHLRPNPCDFTIITNGFVFGVHYSLLQKESGFFKALFRTEFAETKTRSINFRDDNILAVARLISYVYFDSYADVALSDVQPSIRDMLQIALVDKSDLTRINKLLEADGGASTEKGLLEKEMRLHILADKYACRRLKKHTLRRMVELISGSNSVSIWDMVDMFIISGINKSSWEEDVNAYLDTYVEAYIYDERFHAWIAEGNLSERMLKAAYRNGRNATR